MKSNILTIKEFGEKLKEVLFRHKSRIDSLENRINFLENRIEILENQSENPWKMPFD